MPSPATDPYLSFVIAARNDNYAGGMLRRLQVCIDTFLHQAETFELPSELILVDWNSPPDTQALGDAVDWRTSTRWCSVRVIHRCPSSGSRDTALWRSAAARSDPSSAQRRHDPPRTRRQFVLPTSADILCSGQS
mgnify:CR=1 FL=1